MKSDELEERIAPGDGKPPGAISADQRGEKRTDSLSWKNPSFDRTALMNYVSGIASGRGGRNTPAEGIR